VPLPEGNMDWPPKGWAEIYRRYGEHAAWYSGDPLILATVLSALAFSPTPKGRFWARSIGEERRVMLHVPIAGDISTASADLLFSEAPAVRIPEAHEERASTEAKAAQERLDEILAEAGVFSRLIEAAESASALGGVFFRVTWDSSVSEYPILSILQVDQALPEFKWGRLFAVTFWQQLSLPEDHKVVRHLERYERGKIFHAFYIGTSDKLGVRQVWGSYPAMEGLQEIVELSSDLFPVWYVPNILPNRIYRGSALGRSDYSGSEGLMDALDEVYTSWMRDVRLAQGRLIVPASWLERKMPPTPSPIGIFEPQFSFDVDKEVFAPLDIDPLAAKEKPITLVQFDIRAEQHRLTCQEFVERIISNAGYSPQTFGLEIQGRAESGTALGIRERKSMITKSKKQNYFKSVVEQILKTMLIVDQLFLHNSTPQGFRPVVEFKDSFMNDPRGIAETVEILQRAQAISTETKVRMVHPDWGEDQVIAEVQKIQDEGSITLENPERPLPGTGTEVQGEEEGLVE